MKISEYKNLIGAINDMIDNILDEYKSVHPDVVIDDVAVNIDDASVNLSPSSDSLYYVEHGRAPGKFPPVDVMTEWAAKRVSLPRDINSLAYLAGRHVSLNGTQGDNKWEEITAGVLAEWKPKLEAALLLDFQQIEIKDIIRIK